MRFTTTLMIVIVVNYCEEVVVKSYPLTRIASQRRVAAAAAAARAISSSFRLLFQYTQVIADVDDTLKSSGGVNVAGVYMGGIDSQYSRGELYPGVAEFILHLSMGTSTTRSMTPPKVALLTARAEEFKAALELKEDSKIAVSLRQAGEACQIANWGIGPVLYGSVAEWILQDRKGLRKFANFERLLRQDPTGQIMQYVYVGDTGELDQEAGETMLKEYPELVQAVFLHVVTDEGDQMPVMPPPKLINGRPLVFFRTYVGAAVMARQLGFLTLDGLERVVLAACQRLEGVPNTDSKWRDLQLDVTRANRLLRRN